MLSGLPLDRDAVRAVLAAADVLASASALPELPAGLTERELDVLRLLAAGRTNGGSPSARSSRPRPLTGN